MMLGGGGSARFDQRISHAGSLLLHGFERLANHGGTHAHGTEVADFLDLQQVGEGIGRRGDDNARTLPVRQLARSEMENSE